NPQPLLRESDGALFVADGGALEDPGPSGTPLSDARRGRRRRFLRPSPQASRRRQEPLRAPPGPPDLGSPGAWGKPGVSVAPISGSSRSRCSEGGAFLRG